MMTEEITWSKTDVPCKVCKNTNVEIGIQYRGTKYTPRMINGEMVPVPEVTLTFHRKCPDCEKLDKPSVL